MDLTFTVFERLCVIYYHAKFGGNWTTNNGGGGAKYPSLNRVKAGDTSMASGGGGGGG